MGVISAVDKGTVYLESSHFMCASFHLGVFVPIDCTLTIGQTTSNNQMLGVTKEIEGVAGNLVRFTNVGIASDSFSLGVGMRYDVEKYGLLGSVAVLIDSMVMEV